MKTLLLKSIKPTLLLLVTIVTLISCDKDFVNVESDIRGVQNFNTERTSFPFKTYNKKTEAVQTNNLPNYMLGVYDDPNYGASVASIVTQLEPESLTPDFTANSEILSVRLYIPYFSTLTDIDAETGDSFYELDSIFGNALESIKLSVYQNNFFLRNLDPDTNFEDPQAYYSSAYQDLNLNAFEGELLYENDSFFPNPAEIVITPASGNQDDIERRVPGVWLNLNDPATLVNDDFWSDLLLAPENNQYLTSNTAFKDFFRGLIIKAELNDASQIKGRMAMLNLLNNAKVDVEYDVDNTTEEDDDIRTYTLDFGGITFNTFENLSNFPVLTDGDETNGDDQLFIKGFGGSMSIIELFDGTVLDQNNVPQDALEYFKSQKGKWLINEANLTFYVDQTAVSNDTESEPDRMLLFDLETNIPIIDYFRDPTDDLESPNNSKIIHAPLLERESSISPTVRGAGIKYKFRVTEHLNRILNGDSENVKLGLYVSTNVNVIAPSNIEGTTEDDTVNFTPQSSVMAPEGTILHGSKASVPENLRATLEIFYTESQN